MNMWMVRAGKAGFLAENFEEKSIIAIGWGEIEQDLNSCSNKPAIQSLVEEAYPDQKKGWVMTSTGQINRFRFELNKGDRVITYNTSERYYLIGTIESDYLFHKDIIPGYSHYRKVKWDGKINRDQISVAARNQLGAILTLFLLSPDIQDEMEGLLQGKSPAEIVNPEESENQIEDLRRDVIEKSHEFIKDKILSLEWDEMQELVAGLLRAMGYKTRVVPKGADRGKDIEASPDGLGLETPRIFVEVKHRTGTKIGADLVRSFVGGRRSTDSCLYVSTGGFSKDAMYEAERSNIPLTLIDSDTLVELLLQHYENLDNDARALVPMVRVYWPV